MSFKRISIAVVVLACVFGAGVLAGRSSRPGAPAGDEGAPVATYRGGELGERAVRAAIGEQPVAIRAGGVAAARRLVEELVRTRVLATSAQQKGYDRDPEVARRLAEQLAAAYVEKEVDGPGGAPATDDEIRAYLEAHRAELGRPERVRVALMSFLAPSAPDRAAKRAKAAAALKDARARAGEYYAFGELARARSEDPRTAPRNGELGELTREELAAAAGPEIATVAFGMAAPGVHDAVLETAAGYHVLKLLGREASYDPRFEDLRDGLRARLQSERRSERRKALLDRAWSDADVKIDEAALARLVAELGR